MHFPSRLSQALFALAALVALAPAAHAQALECGDVESDKAMNFSLYYENYKNGAYEEAQPYLSWILQCAPLYPNERNYARQIEIYDSLSARATDPARKRALLDSALVSYDRMLALFRANKLPVSDYDAALWRGTFILSHQPALENLKPQVATYFREAYDLKPDSIDAYYVTYIVGDLYGRQDTTNTLAFIEQVTPRFESVPQVAEYFAQIQNLYFDTPEKRYSFLKTQYQRKPDDQRIITELFGYMIDGDVEVSQADQALLNELAQKVLALEPSVRTLRLIARYYSENGRSDEAVQLLERAATTADDASTKRDIYYNIGATYAGAGRLAQARSYYRRALDVDGNHGPSLYGIANLYLQAGSSCGNGEIPGRAIYWLAVDYLERAARAGVGEAASLAGRMRQYFPSSEQLFFAGIQKGSSYSVSGACYGWVGESTRVR